jgi:hypothetical protein
MHTTIKDSYVTSIGMHTIPDNVSIFRVVSPHLEYTTCCSTNALQHCDISVSHLGQLDYEWMPISLGCFALDITLF